MHTLHNRRICPAVAGRPKGEPAAVAKQQRPTSPQGTEGGPPLGGADGPDILYGLRNVCVEV